MTGVNGGHPRGLLGQNARKDQEAAGGKGGGNVAREMAQGSGQDIGNDDVKRRAGMYVGMVGAARNDRSDVGLNAVCHRVLVSHLHSDGIDICGEHRGVPQFCCSDSEDT